MLSVLPSGLYAAPHDEMDYGPFLSGTFVNLAPKGNVPLKGIAVKFENNGEKIPLGGVIFDTETLRLAAGWSGGFLNLKGVVFDGGHGSNPSISGTQIQGTKYAPGWAKGNDLKDPRSIPHGPLPRDWAKYKGLIRTGKEVIFLYTVGTTEVQEQPLIEKVEGQIVVTRHFNISKHNDPLICVVADVDEAKGTISEGIATLTKGEHVTLARVIGGEGTTLEIVENARIVVKLPPSESTSQVRLVTWSGKDKAEGLKSLQAIKGTKDLSPLQKGGEGLWKETVTTKGKKGDEKWAYTLDEIEVPFKNPYKSWMRFGGFDFLPDGRIAVSTWSGDVWIVSGIDENLEKVTWKRYAAGLFHALGLKVVGNEIYVLGRDQITRLKDLNNDGEADAYECFNNDVMITQNFHEFAFELQTDSEGNFYFTKGGPVRPGGSGWDKITPHHGCLFKVSKDGEKFEVVARGLRAPNGMGVGPKGELTCGDNEGTWTPVCPLNWIKAGAFLGVPDFVNQPMKPTVRDNPLCWMPKDVDNSNGGQVWITSNQFGPLSGQLLHASYGTCTLYLVLKEEVAGQMQGGVVPLPLKFDSGICRLRFNEKQNALFLTGLRGWQTRAGKDAGLYRVRYTGKPANLPIALRAKTGELTLTFSDPLEKKNAEDVDSYSIQRWNYRWTQAYGSKQYKVSDPKKEGRDDLEIDSVQLDADNKTLTLKIPELAPVMQQKIDLKFKAADGTPIKTTIHHTLNVVGDKKGEIHVGEYKIVEVK